MVNTAEKKAVREPTTSRVLLLLYSFHNSNGNNEVRGWRILFMLSVDPIVKPRLESQHQHITQIQYIQRITVSLNCAGRSHPPG